VLVLVTVVSPVSPLAGRGVLGWASVPFPFRRHDLYRGVPVLAEMSSLYSLLSSTPRYGPRTE
jgi:hypothetical protein